MSKFIRVEIALPRCSGLKECGGCIRVCPVNIFGDKDNLPSIIHENQDECTLCDLCLKACNLGAIAITKLYEE